MHPIDSDNLVTGDKVSINQIESSTPGYVDHFKGKPASAKYHAALVYVDHVSRYTFIKCRYSTGAQEALEGKCIFEWTSTMHGVKIKTYQADN